MNELKSHRRLRLKQDNHIAVEKRIETEDFILHWHSYFEIEIIISGKGICLINGVEYDISQYNMFFLTPTDFHDFKVIGDTCVINISFDEEMISEKNIAELMHKDMERAYKLTCDELSRMISVAEILMHECDSNGYCQEELLRYILSTLTRKSNVTLDTSLSRENCRSVKKAIAFMEMHFKEDISLGQISNEAGYNPTYFSELFKKVTGETYIETLTKLRLSYAREILANGLSVSDACFMSGFGSLSNFLSVFKKNCKMTPSQYRMSCRKK